MQLKEQSDFFFFVCLRRDLSPHYKWLSSHDLHLFTWYFEPCVSLKSKKGGTYLQTYINLYIVDTWKTFCDLQECIFLSSSLQSSWNMFNSNLANRLFSEQKGTLFFDLTCVQFINFMFNTLSLVFPEAHLVEWYFVKMKFWPFCIILVYCIILSYVHCSIY